ncbi:MAG TPA: hypothetical protein VHC40_05265 [Rhizomicrobium sp.]|nr:hypothetical protein [Rhizomicrobium sp.]
MTMRGWGVTALFGILLSAGVSGPAMAEPTRDEVMAGAARCDGISDNRAWLDCFYGSAQPMRVLLGLSPAPAAQVRLVPPPGAASARKTAARPAPAERSGGFFSELLGSTRPVVTDMPMTSYRFARDRTFTVTLQDGQVYQQEESDLTFARWTRPAATYLVTIQGSGDKYTLRVKDDPGATFRVRRR